MRYGIVDANGNVVNVIEYDTAPSTPPPGFSSDFVAVQSDVVGPGWTYASGVLKAPVVIPSEPLPVTQVTPRQARLALFSAGLLPAVEAAVTHAGGVTQIAWDYATVIARDDPLTLTLGAALGLTAPQIDALFLTASTL